MILRLSIRPSKEGLLVLSYPPFGRMVYLVIAAVLGLQMILTGELSIVMFIFMGVSAITALYEERWIFDNKDGTVIRTAKLGFELRRQRFLISAISKVLLRMTSNPQEIENNRMDRIPSIPELLQKGRTVLLLELKPAPEDDVLGKQRIVIQDGSLRERKFLEMLGSAIASYCGIDLEKQLN